MKTSKILSTVAVALMITSAAAAPAKPNIIYILADDLGIGNVSCYGADQFKTPHIDALASQGMRFDNCYATPLCGPSRAVLLTGRYGYRTGMTGNASGSRLKPANEVMIPTLLKKAGYVTAMCGKWSQIPLMAGDWGFDEYLQFHYSGMFWNTQKGNKDYTVNGKVVPLPDQVYLPDKMEEFVEDFIGRHKDRPFFVYYSLSHVHGEILPTPDSKPGQKDYFADNVTYMDKLVGKLIAELERLKLRDNTLIIFAGDNGTTETYSTISTVHGRPLSGAKGSMLEGGALVPCIANWPGHIAPGQECKQLIGFADFLPTLVAVGGGKIPPTLKIDGKDFSQPLLGKSTVWPRDWAYVQLGAHWYTREPNWKLDEVSKLFDMRDAPFTEKLVDANSQSEEAIAARKRMQAVLDDLNPAAGYKAEGNGSGRAWDTDKNKAAGGQKWKQNAPTGKAGKAAKGVPGNTNDPKE